MCEQSHGATAAYTLVKFEKHIHEATSSTCTCSYAFAYEVHSSVGTRAARNAIGLLDFTCRCIEDSSV